MALAEETMVLQHQRGYYIVSHQNGIGQKAFAILPNDTIDTIREKGLKLEWELYPECIRFFAENRLKIESRAIGEKDGKPVTRNVVTVG